MRNYVVSIKKTAFFLVSAVILFVPVLSLAIVFPGEPTQTGALNVQTFVSTIVKVIWWIFMGAVVIFFIIIAVMFLKSDGEPEQIKTARRALIWGCAGVLVGLLAFYMLRIIGATFGIL